MRRATYLSVRRRGRGCRGRAAEYGFVGHCERPAGAPESGVNHMGASKADEVMPLTSCYRGGIAKQAAAPLIWGAQTSAPRAKEAPLAAGMRNATRVGRGSSWQQTLQTQALSADAALPLAVIECDKSLPCERPQRPTLMSALSPA